jgi:hypothetical protein
MPQMAQQQMPQMAAGGGLMYEEGGLATLPAYNMDTVDMAGGGIIAFEDGGEVPGFYKGGDPRMYDEEGNYIPLSKRNAATNQNIPIEKLFRRLLDTEQAGIESVRRKELDPRERRGDQPGDFPMYTPNPVDTTSLKDPAKDPAKDRAKPPVPPSAGDGGMGGMPTYEDMMNRRTTDFLAKFEGLGDKKRESQTAELNKERGIGALFRGSSALLGSRNLSEAGAKFGKEQGAAMAAERAESRGIEDVADQYNFNIAKAREAAEKGDMQLAMQYTQLANQNQYQMGSLDVARQRNQIFGEAGNMQKVSLALGQADKQALAEAKQKYPVLTSKNQAAYDAFFKKRARELKIGNPLTKQYADLSGRDLGGSAFNVVQSLPKGATAIDPTEG